MQAFTTLNAAAAPIDIVNCDTDQIIPARFLRKDYDNPDYPSYFMHDLRFDEAGAARPDFILNQPAYRDAQIIVADTNWGCGSSREGAVVALLAYGIHCVIAPSFGDIHYNNGMKNGMLPVRLPEADCDTLRAQLHEQPGAAIAVDLAAQQVTGPDGNTYAFDIDAFDKHCMLNGLDDISLTFEYRDAFAAFEARRKQAAPWLF
jgi:3-isopropylmalate/(R)-2-methylmalate dehydratase small subunit